MSRFERTISRLAAFCLICLAVSGCDKPQSSGENPGRGVWYEPTPQEQNSSVQPHPGPFENHADSQTETLSSEKTMGEDSAEQAQFPPENSSENSSVKAASQNDSLYGIGVSLQGFRPFPDDDPWNQDISKHEVDPNSAQILAYIGLNGNLHPDFGSGTWNGSKIGIPYVVVGKDQPRVSVRYEAYGDESDPGPYPLPFNTPVEGDPYEAGDRHAIVIDRDNWKLYELFRAFPVNGGASWRADSGAIFDLNNNTQRPRGWTSADAAGLPIFPGLVRYDEVGEQKKIRHALRFTLAKTRRAFVAPASHWASSNEHPLLPPMGMRVRLKQEFSLEGYPESARIILEALKTYGMILADNGSDWFISGSPDERWNNNELRTLRQIKVKDLEILKMDTIVTPYSF